MMRTCRSRPLLRAHARGLWAGAPPAVFAPLARLVAALAVLVAAPVGAAAAQTVERYELEPLTHLPALVPESEPVARIGGLDASEEALIGQLQAAHLTAEGGVVLVDRSEPRVRVFGPDGRLRHALGRTGAGPGEFQARSSLDVFPLEDGRVVVWDRARRAAMRFGPDGELEDHFSLFESLEVDDAVPSLPRLLGVLGDGSYVTESELRPRAPPRGARITLGEVALHRIDPATGEAEFWRRLPKPRPVRIVQVGGGVTRYGETHSTTLDETLGEALIALEGDRVVWMRANRPVLEWWSPHGGAERQAELAIPLRPMGAEERDRAVATIARRHGGGAVDPRPGDGDLVVRQGVRTGRRAEPAPDPELEAPARALLEEIEHLPAVAGIQRHSGGEIWIQTLYVEEEDHPHPGATLVLSDRGRPLAWYRPRRDEDPDDEASPVRRVLDARDGLVLLLLRDELDVEEVQVRRLELRPPTGGQ